MISVAEEIIQLYQKHGHIAYGEDCSVLSHSFQSGQLAIEQGLDEELILAAFLHDIGHLYPLELNAKFQKMGGYGITAHDVWGGEYLKAKGFPQRIVAAVSNHVNAKRYLCWRDADYYRQLSVASQKTMVYQGGVMNDKEAAQFELNPYFEDALIIRKIDEAAKGIDYDILPEQWDILKELINRNIIGNRIKPTI